MYLKHAKNLLIDKIEEKNIQKVKITIIIILNYNRLRKKYSI